MEELDLKKLISIFWNKRLHITIICAVAAIVGVIYSFYFVTPKYEATTSVVLVKDTTDSGEVTSADLGLASKLIGTYSKIVKGKTTLRTTINNLGINETEDTLVKKITVSEVKNAEMLTISVKDENPVNAMKTANELTKVFADSVKNIYGIDIVRVLDEAEQPMTPCNVNHARDVLIFIVVGLVISVVYVLLTNMFDNTIKDGEDIENNTDLITLVSIPFINDESKKGGKN